MSVTHTHWWVGRKAPYMRERASEGASRARERAELTARKVSILRVGYLECASGGKQESREDARWKERDRERKRKRDRERARRQE